MTPLHTVAACAVPPAKSHTTAAKLTSICLIPFMFANSYG
jgi:hypothetical protein